MRKNWGRSAWLLLLLPLLIGCTLPQPSQLVGEKETAQVVRVATIFTEGSPGYQQLTRFAQLLEETSDGQLVARIYQAGEWGQESSSVDYLKLGNIEMACVPAQDMSGQVLDYAIYGLPYLFSSDTEIATYIQGERGAAALQLLSAPLQGVGFVNDGYLYYLATQNPGQTSAVPAGGSWQSFASLEKWAQTKSLPPESIVTTGNAYYSLHMAFCQQSWWEALGEQQQGWVSSAFAEALQWSLQQQTANEQQARLVELGVNYQPMTAETEATFMHLLTGIREDYFAQHADALTGQWRPIAVLPPVIGTGEGSTS